jgi:hypothetical protein
LGFPAFSAAFRGQGPQRKVFVVQVFVVYLTCTAGVEGYIAEGCTIYRATGSVAVIDISS